MYSFFSFFFFFLDTRYDDSTTIRSIEFYEFNRFTIETSDTFRQKENENFSLWTVSFQYSKKRIVIHKRLRSQSTFVHCMRIELPYVSKYRSRLNINYQRFQSSNFERISKERYFISDLDSNLDEKGKIYHAPSNLLNEPRYCVEIRTWNRNRRTISIPIPERGARNTFSHSESSEWRHRAIERRPWSSNRWKKSLHLKVRP